MDRALVEYGATVYGDHGTRLEVAVYEDDLLRITYSEGAPDEDKTHIILPKGMALALSSALTRVVSLNADILA